MTRVPLTATQFILPLAKRLREGGNHVQFAFGPGDGLPEIEDCGFPFTVMKMHKRSDSVKNVRVIRELRQIIKNGHFDVVHTYSPVIGVYGRLAACRTKTLLVAHSVIGSIMAPGVPLPHRLMYIMSELTTSRMVDLFITLNHSDAHDLARFGRVPARKVVTLKYEYGVDLRKFNPESIDRTHLDEARKRYGIQKGVPVIGFVGRMIASKGILDLFEAYRQIRRRGVMAKLVYLGDVLLSDKDQSSISRLKAMVTESGCEADVIFLGFQKAVPLYLSMMDVAVLPSHHEGFPRVPIEAGAMGKPSVCTATSGAEMAIDDGKTGFIAPIKNPLRLGEAIQKIITDPALSQQMGSNARRRVLDYFDQDKILDEQVRIYSDFFGRQEKIKGYQT